MGELNLHAMDEPQAATLGVSAEQERPAPGFMRFAGGLTAKDATEMRAALDASAFSRMDGEDGSET